MFKLPIPTRLTDYLGEAVVWTVISYIKLNREWYIPNWFVLEYLASSILLIVFVQLLSNVAVC